MEYFPQLAPDQYCLSGFSRSSLATSRVGQSWPLVFPAIVAVNVLLICSVSIHWANGRILNPPLRQFIAKNRESRVIDLPGQDRVMTTVTLIYKSRPESTERAIVQLYGKTK